MGRRLVFEGRSEEEAIREASKQLGRPLVEGEYRLSENRTGFFGVNRRVVLEVEDGEAGSTTEPPSEAGEERREGRGVGNEGSQDATPDDVELVKGLVSDILQGVGVEVEAKVEGRGDTLFVELSGPDQQRLTERQGEFLGATQFLIEKIVARESSGMKKVVIDAGGFRSRREEELRDLAQKTALAVKRSGKKALLPPMTPSGRRQIHMTLADDPEVETESEGEGFKKRVGVFLRRPGS